VQSIVIIVMIVSALIPLRFFYDGPSKPIVRIVIGYRHLEAGIGLGHDHLDLGQADQDVQGGGPWDSVPAAVGGTFLVDPYPVDSRRIAGTLDSVAGRG
jgi:hypothetical protein